MMIFNIQRYSTHDGPGIRTVIFLKGCSLKCHWCQNPESRSPQKQILLDHRLCIEGCHLCISKCSNAIKSSTHGPLIERNKLIDQDYIDLEHICPSQALTVCGDNMSEDDIMQVINKDRIFYQRSGGGVTLSGGEPFMQDKLSSNLLKQCKIHGYHTAVETCLHVPWKNIMPSLNAVDLFLADLKHVDSKKLNDWTGGSAKRILDNFKRLAKSNKQITIRVPLIQGFNADRISVKDIIDFVANEIPTNEIHFLPYHTLGMHKYKMLNMPYYAPTEPLNDIDLIEYATSYAQSQHLTAILHG